MAGKAKNGREGRDVGHEGILGVLSIYDSTDRLPTISSAYKGPVGSFYGPVLETLLLELVPLSVFLVPLLLLEMSQSTFRFRSQ